jgi:hypothetical protein
MNGSKGFLMIAGLVLALGGVLAIAVPYFTTEKTTDVAKVAGLSLSVKEDTTHTVPPWLAPVALGAGLLLIGASTFQRG